MTYLKYSCTISETLKRKAAKFQDKIARFIIYNKNEWRPTQRVKALGKKAMESAMKSIMMGTVARRIYLTLTIALNDNEHNKQGQSGSVVRPAVPVAPQIWTNDSLMFMAYASVPCI